MEVGIETGQIHKNKRKEKNLRNSHLGDEHAENSAAITYGLCKVSYMLIWMRFFSRARYLRSCVKI